VRSVTVVAEDSGSGGCGQVSTQAAGSAPLSPNSADASVIAVYKLLPGGVRGLL